MKFVLGPGSTPNGDLLWDPNCDDTNYYEIKLKAFVSTNATPPVNPVAPQLGAGIAQGLVGGPP